MAPKVQTVSAAKPQRFRRFAWALAIATSWLAMFAVGGFWQESIRPSPTPNTRPIGLPPAIEQMLVREQGDESSRLESRRPFVGGSPDSGRRRRDPSQFAAEVSPLPNQFLSPDMADILKLFREQGLEPKVLDAHIPVQLKDGRRFIIPVTKRDRREFAD